MPEIDRLSGSTDWIDLEFVQRERTPKRIIEVGIQLHLAGLSLSNTKQYLERLGCQMESNGCPQLGAENRRTADQRYGAGSHRS